MKKQTLIILLSAIAVTVHVNIMHYGTREVIDKNAITRSEYDEMKKRLTISEALVKKCSENDTIDIMQYVRDIKREIEVEFERD